MQWLQNLVERLLADTHVEQLRLQETNSPEPMEFVEFPAKGNQWNDAIRVRFTARDPQTDDIATLWVNLDLDEGKAWLSNGRNRVGPVRAL